LVIYCGCKGSIFFKQRKSFKKKLKKNKNYISLKKKRFLCIS